MALEKNPGNPPHACFFRRRISHRRIVSAVRAGNLAAAFIQSYAAHYDRQEFLVHAERSRELQVFSIAKFCSLLRRTSFAGGRFMRGKAEAQGQPSD